VLSLAESITIYANHVGERAARSAEETLQDRPQLLVLSTEKIGLNGTGVVLTETQPDTVAKYRYRYSGLRLLLRTGKDQLLIVPEGWRKGHDTIALLKEDDRIRIELLSSP
jgi:hypothetical protein